MGRDEESLGLWGSVARSNGAGCGRIGLAGGTDKGRSSVPLQPFLEVLSGKFIRAPCCEFPKNAWDTSGWPCCWREGDTAASRRTAGGFCCAWRCWRRALAALWLFFKERSLPACSSSITCEVWCLAAHTEKSAERAHFSTRLNWRTQSCWKCPGEVLVEELLLW